MIIRPERPEDYSQIADITYEAFSNWQELPFRSEPCIVDSLRSGQFYDPELALVAEEEGTGRIVGHAFFSFFPGVLLGQERKGLFLAPLTVAPAYQRRGVGAQLLAEGARIAAEKEIPFILLCGHPEYYSRFGYQPHAFSLQGCTVSLSPSAPDPSIAQRPVRQSDLPWLTRRWKQLHLDDRLALYPGDLAMQWYSHSPATWATVFTRGETVLGYARYTKDLIKDLVPLEQNASAILHQITNKKEVTLPLTAACAASLGLTAQEAFVTSPAYFMLNVTGDPLVTQYLQESKSQPGIVVFPATIDLDE